MAYTRITDIDVAFPVAGVDNESQGFRDNFSAIADVLTAIETDVAGTSGLQVTSFNVTDTETDLGGNKIFDAQLRACTSESYQAASIVADQNISFLNGGYQVLPINADVVFNLADWPNVERYAVIRLHLVGYTSTARTVDFTVDGGGDIYYDDTWLGLADAPTLTIESTSTATLVEFWTYDGGATVYAKYLGQFSTP